MSVYTTGRPCSMDEGPAFIPVITMSGHRILFYNSEMTSLRGPMIGKYIATSAYNNS